ncbi:hypothetical protein BGV40_00640 [Methanosarcina sp. Ant1]|nr:hypothetical protein BGV40_00640 [Methanosarcina sp. Ant1]
MLRKSSISLSPSCLFTLFPDTPYNLSKFTIMLGIKVFFFSEAQGRNLWKNCLEVSTKVALSPTSLIR